MANPSRIPKTFRSLCHLPTNNKTSLCKTMEIPTSYGNSNSKSSSSSSCISYNSKYSSSRFVVGTSPNLIFTQRDCRWKYSTEPNELYSLLRCPTPVQSTPNNLTLNIYMVFRLQVRFPPPASCYLIMDSCSPFSLLYRATRSGESRICVTDDAPTADSIIPDVRPPSSIPAGEITDIQFTHAASLELCASQHCFPTNVYAGRYRL